MNLFIIEDDRVLRTELMKLLCSYGYQCDYSEDWQSIVRPPTDAVKLQAANLMQDLLNSQNPCYVAFMKNRNRKPKKAG